MTWFGNMVYLITWTHMERDSRRMQVPSFSCDKVVDCWSIDIPEMVFEACMSIKNQTILSQNHIDSLFDQGWLFPVTYKGVVFKCDTENVDKMTVTEKVTDQWAQLNPDAVIRTNVYYDVTLPGHITVNTSDQIYLFNKIPKNEICFEIGTIEAVTVILVGLALLYCGRYVYSEMKKTDEVESSVELLPAAFRRAPQQGARSSRQASYHNVTGLPSYNQTRCQPPASDQNENDLRLFLQNTDRINV